MADFYGSGMSKYDDLSKVTLSPNVPGIVTGNPIIDMILSMMMGGSGVAPVPGQGQGVYDAFLQRDRSRGFLRHMQGGFANSLIMQKLGGLDTSSTFGQIASTALGTPDGLMDTKLARAFNGGNPIKALMGLNANLTGVTMGMMTGNNMNASEEEVNAVYEGLRQSFFQQKRITEGDAREVSKYNSNEFLDGLKKTKGGSEFFKEFITTNKDGSQSFDFQSFKDKAKDYADKAVGTADEAIIDAYKDALSRADSVGSMRSEVGKLVSTRTDVQKTRGYHIDDLSKAQTMMADLGMLYDPAMVAGKERTEGGMIELSRRFSGSTKVLRAVSDLTGAESATQAVSDLNNLLGNMPMNFGGEDHEKVAKDMENLLRRVKGSARAAGISVESIKGIIEVSRAISAKYSTMQYQGGDVAVETGMKSVDMSTALLQTMGPAWTRRNGGSKNVFAETAVTLTENRDEPIVKQYAAIASRIDQSNLSDEQKEKLYTMLSDAAKDPRAQTVQGRNKVFDQVAASLGTTRQKVLGIAESEMGQTAGMEFMAKRDRQGKGLGLEEAAISMSDAELWRVALMGANGDKTPYRDENGNLLTAKERVLKAREAIGRGENWEQTFQKYGLDTNQALNNMTSTATPEGRRRRRNAEIASARDRKEFQAAYKRQDALTRTYADEAAIAAERYAHLQAPLFDNLAQELLGGEFSKGFEGIKDLIMTDDSRIRTTEILDATRKLSTEKTSAAFMDAYMQLHGGRAGASAEEVNKNLDSEYITDPEERKRLIAQRGKMTEEGLGNLTNVSKKLTIQQILQASKDWNSSKAKELGMDKKAVIAAAAFLKDTGHDSAEVISKFGDKSFNDVMDKIPVTAAVNRSANVAKSEVIKDIGTNADKHFETFFEGLRHKEKGETEEDQKQNLARRETLLKSLETLGLITKDGDKIDVNTQKAVEVAAEDLLFGGADANSIRKKISEGDIQYREQEELIKRGIGERDDKGKFKVKNEKKLDELITRESAIKELQSDKIIGGGADQVRDITEKAEKSQISAVDEVAKGIKELQNSTGGQMQFLGKIMNEINQTLKSFTGAGS